jgi:hypothetical protein
LTPFFITLAIVLAGNISVHQILKKLNSETKKTPPKRTKIYLEIEAKNQFFETIILKIRVFVTKCCDKINKINISLRYDGVIKSLNIIVE